MHKAPVSCLLVPQKPRDAAALAAPCSKQDTPLFPAPDTRGHPYSRRYTNVSQEQQQQREALESAAASRGTARTFRDVPVRGQRAVSRSTPRRPPHVVDSVGALINGFSNIPTHQKKTVYLCQLLIRTAKGKNLECHFENDKRISPLESALSFWTLLEREEIKLEKLHEDIRRLIQIQIVAVYMEKGYFKEAAEVLERLFTDSASDKPLRVKLATVIKSKDPYVPLLQSFSYDLLISKIKSYIELYMKENETNFLIQAAAKQVESKGLGTAALQNKTVNVNENDKRNLETKQRPHSGQKHRMSRVLRSLNSLQNVEEHGDALACGRRRQRWTYKEDLELKSGVREFGVGNWAKILVHGDFNNRTSVMLKDRWRTLCRIEQG
ncbi:PREDICTED: telomeric repeat-binding factor 1 [Nipponia nippon]|uniref:telomeric repeat-binding factor 1 n=1 Tax=Nipponia nippon TaxID=128390 RepID=UPI000510DAA4|nr:PREDICTED: telomeric repeat-binding factor 1 [Nipponia nippon]